MIDRLDRALSGRYRVERELGEGGMATVYLAEDLKHERKVAIKVLRPELAAVIGAERFVAEIRTTAQLQHPHILPLFDSGEADGFLYYVMPYIEGESLREKLDREKQLGVEEALGITRSVADALDYAHRQGVIHRDIKPANILLHDGRPVVADFGIAVAISAAGGGRLTETGLSLGTPHYMSPEQATADRDLTARSDVYSLGCVLYEMLTGDPPHTASTAQAVLVRILTEPPRPVTAVRASVPPHVSAALQKALEKLPADRFRSAEEFTDALDDPLFRWETRQTGTVARPREAAPATSWLSDTRSRLALAGAAILALAGLGLGRALAGPDGRAGPLPGTGPVHRYVVSDTLAANLLVAISSRGDVAYEGVSDGREHIRIRRAADTVAHEVPGTTGGNVPVFSPDGEWIAFSVEPPGIRKVQLATGTAVTVVPPGRVSGVFPSQWTDDGMILFDAPDGIYRVPDVGGEPELLLEGPSGGFARLLPDGRTLVYTTFPGGDLARSAVMVADLETGDTTTLVESGGNAQWSPTGHILYGHPSGTLFARPFDLDRRRPAGPPVPVREGAYTLGTLAFFQLSPDGSLVYMAGGARGGDLDTQAIEWMDLSGARTPTPVSTDHTDVQLSPDGRQLAYTRGGQIYLFDLEIGTNQRFTLEGTNHHNPVWSGDGTRLAFASSRDGGRGGVDVWAKDVDGRSPAEWLAGTEEPDYPTEWLEDGTLVLVQGLVPTDLDIMMARPGHAEGEATPLLRADWNEFGPAVSPDGTLMAYVSTQTGEPHLFVREFPGMAGGWQVSERPVSERPVPESAPVWSLDGTSLYYMRGEQTLIRADVRREPSFRVVNRIEMLTTDVPMELKGLHPDGRRLLVSRPLGTGDLEARPRITVVVNWMTELRERLEEGG